jgi:SAM-dependent methyltransferase
MSTVGRYIWHDLECGAYVEDLALWRTLAAEHGEPVLDVGAGTGRTALDLARRGVRVTALDRDPELLAELRRRGEGLPLDTVEADAREFALERRFPLCIVPMQTIQLLDGRAGRSAFLFCARRHLEPGGALAIALADELEPYETVPGGPTPLPDIRELDGVVYASLPTAVRLDGDGFILERRREVITTDGTRSVQDNTIRLDRLEADQLEAEADAVGLAVVGRVQVPFTAEYVGSTVVILGA